MEVNRVVNLLTLKTNTYFDVARKGRGRAYANTEQSQNIDIYIGSCITHSESLTPHTGAQDMLLIKIESLLSKLK